MKTEESPLRDGDPPSEAAPAPDVQPAPAETPSVSRAERRETAAQDALRALIRDHYLQHFGAPPPNAGDWPIVLRLTVQPDRQWATRFDPPFAEQLPDQIEDAQAGRGRYVEGRVYCFRCGSSDCLHAAPPGPLEVFKSYSPTGVPEWHELAQALIEMKDERIDQLFGAPPCILSAMQLGGELRHHQLSSFGRASKTYAILGQVVAGYFSLPRKRRAMEPWPDRMAVTFQLVETREASGQAHFALNAIAGGVSVDQWNELLVAELDLPIARGLSEARRRTREIEERVRDARRAGAFPEVHRLLGGVPGILRRLSRTIEQAARQSQRRTRHAEQHPRQLRPVHKALEDARAAAVENLFFDERKQTWIAVGKQGRTHAFNQEGKHVTSFSIQPGSADFRVRTARWRPLRAEEVAAFRSLIAAVPAAAEPGSAPYRPPHPKSQ